jgi:hypothetical protein
MEQSRHGQGITSVKVHHQPGGASSFSLAHDDGTGTDDRWGGSNKIGNAPRRNNNPIVPQEETKLPSEQKKENCPDAGPGAFTSVKYSGNPPGGKSSFTLG